MRLHRLAAPAAALGLAWALAGCGSDAAPELIAKAQQALAAKDTKAAQIHLKNALQKDAQSAEARLLLGQVLLEGGDARGALVEFDKAAQAGMAAARLAPLHARALAERREWRTLVDRYLSSGLEDPQARADVLVHVAQALLQLDRSDEARGALEKALVAVPGHVGAEVALARHEASTGNADGALRRIDVLLSGNANDSAWRLKGDLEALHRKDAVAARKAYEKAAELGAKSVDSQLALITHLLGAREFEAAEQRIKVARGNIGDQASLRFYHVVLEMERGRLDAANELIQPLLKAAPDEGRIALLAGQLEFLREQYPQAEAHLVRAVGLSGNATRPRLLLAQTYLRLNDPARALQTLQPLFEATERPPRVHAIAGEAYLSLGETRKSDEQFKLAAAQDPRDMRSRTLMALGQLSGGKDQQRGMSELRELSDSFESPVADLALIHTFMRKGDARSALDAIDAIERKMPGKGTAPTLRAQVLRGMGKPQEADAQLAEALKRDPKYLPAALAQARQDLKAKLPARAVERVAAVLRADPDNLVTRLAWLSLRQQAGEPLEAIESDLKSLVQKQPREARPRQALVQLLVRRGRLSEAAAAAQQAVAALPTEATLVEQLAEVQLRQREPALAAKTLAQLAELRPAAAEPLLRLAEVERQRGNTREALAAVKRALAARSQHPGALRQQILLEAELGNVEQARRLVKDMQAIAGLEAQAAAAEGDLEAQQQQYAVAESAYRRALARHAGLPEVPAKLARTLLAAGKKTEVDAFAREWLRDHPLDVGLPNFLGDVALNERQYAAARTHYERSLASVSAQPLVLNNLAWIAQQQGDLKRAESLARDALRLSPGESSLHDTLSGVLSAAGQHEGALAAQREAVQLDASPMLRVGLAKRLIAAGRKDAARDELQAVQQLGNRYAGQAEVGELLAKL